MRTVTIWPVLVLAGPVAAREAADIGFSVKPTATRSGEKVKISFGLSGPGDAEVAVLDAKGKIVRHLAAGLLGGKNPPPEPFQRGLSQILEWDGKDDLGHPARGGPFKVRVRAGMVVKFGGFIGADPYNIGKVASSAEDEAGNVYVLGYQGFLNQGHFNLRVYDAQGRYMHELLPFSGNLPPDAVRELASWDEGAKRYHPKNRASLNPNFYGRGKLSLVSVSRAGIVLSGGDQTLVLDPSGGVLAGKSGGGSPAVPGSLKAFESAKAKQEKGEIPLDWNRIAVDYPRDEVYVNDGTNRVWRYDGTTGEGALLKKGGKNFWATDLAVGYDGLLYVRRGNGYGMGSDYSGPLERYTRDLEPAPYPSGTHVLSRYIYSRYGVGYAERGLGVAPDGTLYVSFMHDWVKYCTAAFGPDGKALKGAYLQGKVGRNGGQDRRDTGKEKLLEMYPPELDSAIIGPIPQANAGVRVDLQGNIYLGMLHWPDQASIPGPWEKDPSWRAMVGSVVKFTKAGGCAVGPENMTRADAFRGAVGVYPGLAPFSGGGFGGNSAGCVCRTPRFDLDRYGRLLLPNAVTNSVQLVDNAGNVILEFGKYGNFDSEYAAPGAKTQAASGEIPLTWPTGAGFGMKHMYVLDTYSRRVVRVQPTYAVESTSDVK